LECVEDTLERGIEVRLRGQWIEVPVAIGDVIHVLDEKIVENRDDCLLIDDGQNFLVHSPDCLVSGTVVADSFHCLRRAILNEKYKNPHEITSDTVYGSLWHEIFGHALRSRNFDESYLRQSISSLTMDHLDDLYAIQNSEMVAQEKLMTVMPQLQMWYRKFYDGHTFSEVINDGRNTLDEDTTRRPTSRGVTMRLADVLDIEENIWSPTLGLKGKIDVSVRMEQQGQSEGDNKEDESKMAPTTSLLVPLELKTGRATKSIAHRAQVSLYSLMMSDRYGK
jgi:DNA replication ATP-dependent helicase Dna2